MNPYWFHDGHNVMAICCGLANSCALIQKGIGHSARSKFISHILIPYTLLYPAKRYRTRRTTNHFPVSRRATCSLAMRSDRDGSLRVHIHETISNKY